MDARCGGGARVADRLPAQGDLPGHGGDAVRGAFGDAFDRLRYLAGAIGGVEGSFFLDVEVLGVLAHDDEVDGGGGGGDGLHGADVGVEVEFLAQGDNGGGVSGDLFSGGGDGPEEGAGAFGAQGVDG